MRVLLNIVQLILFLLLAVVTGVGGLIAVSWAVVGFIALFSWASVMLSAFLFWLLVCLAILTVFGLIGLILYTYLTRLIEYRKKMSEATQQQSSTT